MPAKKHNITVDRGETFELPLRRWTSIKKEVLLDLSSYSARMQIRKSFGSNEALLTLTSAAEGGIVLSDGSGTENILITITSDQSLDLPAPATAIYDIFLTEPGGKRKRLVFGDCVIRPEVTSHA